MEGIELITNFDQDEEKIYRKAVTIYNNTVDDHMLIITNDTFDKYRNRLDGHKSLKLKNNIYVDLSRFWEIFDDIEKKENQNEKINIDINITNNNFICW